MFVREWRNGINKSLLRNKLRKLRHLPEKSGCLSWEIKKSEAAGLTDLFWSSHRKWSDSELKFFFVSFKNFQRLSPSSFSITATAPLTDPKSRDYKWTRELLVMGEHYSDHQLIKIRRNAFSASLLNSSSAPFPLNAAQMSRGMQINYSGCLRFIVDWVSSRKSGFDGMCQRFLWCAWCVCN